MSEPASVPPELPILLGPSELPILGPVPANPIEDININIPRSLKDLDKTINDGTNQGFTIKGSRLNEILCKGTEAAEIEEQVEVEKMLQDQLKNTGGESLWNREEVEVERMVLD